MDYFYYCRFSYSFRNKMDQEFKIKNIWRFPSTIQPSGNKLIPHPQGCPDEKLL